MSVAVLGTGAIGSAVVRRLIVSDHKVTVWNRTPDRAAGLVELGASSAGSVGEAVRSSPLVLVTVKDYTAVRHCVTEAGHDLSGRTVVVLCTGTAQDAGEAAQHVTGLGGQYLDAGVQASPDTIGTTSATILYSGSRSAFQQHLSTLGLLGSARFVGTAPEAAAIWDLALFGVWYDAQLGLLRALETVRRAGIDVAAFAETARVQLGHVVTALPATVTEVLEQTYPAGPASLGEHLPVIRHLADLRSGQPLGDGGMTAVAARIEALIADGRAEEGLSAAIG